MSSGKTMTPRVAFTLDDEERAEIAERIQKTKTCWLWTGTLCARGYGVFYWRGKKLRAHRVSFFAARGDVPEELDHLCNVRRCVNPAHLSPTTHRRNILRGNTAMGRNVRKTHCPKGHPYSGRNLRARPTPRGTWRQCITCHNAKQREMYYRALGRPVPPPLAPIGHMDPRED